MITVFTLKDWLAVIFFGSIFALMILLVAIAGLINLWDRAKTLFK